MLPVLPPELQQLVLEAFVEGNGVTLPDTSGKKELRIDCPFNCTGDAVGKRTISVNAEHPQNVFYCHAYQCQVRGNLLVLMYGWKHGRLPSDSGLLTGAAFKEIKADLVRLVGGEPAGPHDASAPAAAKPKEQAEPKRNTPLARSENDAARGLVTLDEKLVRDVAEMNPKVARYIRQRSFLSPELMSKWRMGYMPSDGSGDKRGLSLRGKIVYPLLSERGEVLCWIGRDPAFEEKHRQWSALPPEQRAGSREPPKYQFPKGFHRGLELFGQQASRIEEPGYRQRIAEVGIVVVEGSNDVIALDALGQPAVGLCSNNLTEEQADKIARFARLAGHSRVVLMLDCEQEGDEGAKEALWQLSQRNLQVKLAWSRAMHGGRFRDRQPESLTREELAELLGGPGT